MGSNHFVKVLQILIYFTLAALVVTTIDNNNNYNFAVGGKVAIDKNWWFTITGISKRFLNEGQSGQLYKRDANHTQGQDSTSGPSANLHNGEFCVDVSTYSDVQYDNDTVEVCDSTFAKKCTMQFEEVIKEYAQILIQF